MRKSNLHCDFMICYYCSKCSSIKFKFSFSVIVTYFEFYYIKMEECVLDIIISAATHRSGSTLVQRIFNSREKTLIWGEQHACLLDFNRIYKNLKEWSEDTNFLNQRHEFFKENRNPNIWIANLIPSKTYLETAIVKATKTFLDEYYREFNYKFDKLGFKEVHYGKEELRLLRKCYRNCKILLIVRNPIDVWSSLLGVHWYKGTLEGHVNKWNKNTGGYLEFLKEDENSFLIKYEDIIERKEDIIELLSELGDIDKESIYSVLDAKIDSSSKVVPEEDKKYILKNCGTLMQRLGYL